MIIFFFHLSLIFKVMHFVVFFYFTFLTKEDIFPFPFREYTSLDCQQNIGAGIDTLMSISDGLGPSIFCRKMEKARPMREEMDGTVVYFTLNLTILTLML